MFRRCWFFFLLGADSNRFTSPSEAQSDDVPAYPDQSVCSIVIDVPQRIRPSRGGGRSRRRWVTARKAKGNYSILDREARDTPFFVGQWVFVFTFIFISLLFPIPFDTNEYNFPGTLTCVAMLPRWVPNISRKGRINMPFSSLETVGKTRTKSIEIN